MPPAGPAACAPAAGGGTCAGATGVASQGTGSGADVGAGNPINVITGNKYQREVDLAPLPGRLGLEIIRGAKKADGKDVWEDGKILDPENGKTYTLKMTPIEGGKKLEVRGSIGPFGRTQTWVRTP